MNEDIRWCFDKKVPLKPEGIFYRVNVRLGMMYGPECWTHKKKNKRKMEVEKIRIFRWTSDRTLLDMIPNVTIKDSLREGWLR